MPTTTVAIEGASPEQDALLRELLGELTLQPRRLAIEPWDPVDWDELASLGIERGDPAHAVPTGIALRLVEPTELSIRDEWELELLGNAFRDASARLGMPEVQCLGHASASASIREFERPEEPAPAPDSVEERVRRAAALTAASVQELELLQPEGLACAVVLVVAEPHGFLRYGLRAFVELSGHFDRSRRGSYLEVRDGGPEPAWITAYAQGLGMGHARGDVTCCDPFYRGGGIEDPGPPPCPKLER